MPRTLASIAVEGAMIEMKRTCQWSGYWSDLDLMDLARAALAGGLDAAARSTGRKGSAIAREIWEMQEPWRTEEREAWLAERRAKLEGKAR